MPLVAAVLGVGVLLAAALSTVAVRAAHRAHAQTGADAVALALAAGDRDGADRVAAANRVRIVEIRTIDRARLDVEADVGVVVVVEYRGVRAQAAAARFVDRETGSDPVRSIPSFNAAPSPVSGPDSPDSLTPLTADR